MSHMPESSSQREMARGLFARRKVMMIPAFGRDQEASRFPIHANEIAAGWPHERITFARDNDDLSTGTVSMRFFISTGFHRHDMTHHRITGEMNAQTAKTDAPLGMIIKLNRR